MVVKKSQIVKYEDFGRMATGNSLLLMYVTLILADKIV